MGKRGNPTDTVETVEWLVKTFDTQELVNIMTGVNEELEDDEFTSTMLAYFETYNERPDPEWMAED